MNPSNIVIEIENETLAHIERTPFPVAISIKKLIKDELPASPNFCIYKVPFQVRNLNERLYTPQVVSIGPFHHGEPKLQAMEEQKLKYLQALLLRNLSLEDCEDMITKWEKEIRSCYSETFDMTRDQLVRIVLVDSCFVIEAILSCFDSTHIRTAYLSKSISLFETDMILIENQLPFFVLDGIYRLVFPHHSETMFLELCIKYFFNQMLMQIDEDKLIIKVKDYLAKSSHQIHHFVDLLRVCHLPSSLRQFSDEVVDLFKIPNATEAHDSGIGLIKSLRISVLDIQFSDFRLKIPQVVLSDISEYLLSNILVLEMCCYKHDSYVRDYVCFMSTLIDTPKDVGLLMKSGIIVSSMRDKSAVASLFNNVGYNFPLVRSKYYFYNVSQALKAHCGIRQVRWKAQLRRDYFTTPWIMVSTAAAIIILVLTFIQTVCSIVQTICSVFQTV